MIGGNWNDADDRYVLTIEVEKKGRKPSTRPNGTAVKTKSGKKNSKVPISEVRKFLHIFRPNWEFNVPLWIIHSFLIVKMRRDAEAHLR